MADCKIREVYTGIAGSHITSFNSSGMVAVKDKEVTATDVARVIETAKAVNIPTDQQVLHVLTQEFIVDSQEDRSEERRVGKKWVSPCRSRCAPGHEKKKKIKKT